MSLIHHAVSHDLRRIVPIGQGWSGLTALWTKEREEMEAFRQLMFDSKGKAIHILDEHQVEELLYPTDGTKPYEVKS